MVRENVHWFGHPCATVTIDVEPAAGNAQDAAGPLPV